MWKALVSIICCCALSVSANPFLGLMTAGVAAPAGGDLVAFTAFNTTGATLRSNFPGWVGVRITMSGNRTVTQLGRWKVTGNTQSHPMKIIRASDSAQMGSTVTIDTTLGTVGTWQYVTMATPASLVSGASYYIISQEFNGGDQFYDDSGNQTASSDYTACVSATYSGYSTDGVTMSQNVANHIFGPVNFKFTNP